jgi:hypothetical protein
MGHEDRRKTDRSSLPRVRMKALRGLAAMGAHLQISASHDPLKYEVHKYLNS